jgi:hypothetical protein
MRVEAASALARTTETSLALPGLRVLITVPGVSVMLVATSETVLRPPSGPSG